MASVGFLQMAFGVAPKSLELVFDQASMQQQLVFNFAVQISVQQLLSELMRFQTEDGPCPSGGGAALNPADAQVPASMPEGRAIDMCGAAGGADASTLSHSAPGSASGHALGLAPASVGPTPGGRAQAVRRRPDRPADGAPGSRVPGVDGAGAFADGAPTMGGTDAQAPAVDAAAMAAAAQEMLVAAVVRGNAAEVRSALRCGAEAAGAVDARSGRPLLHAAIEGGGGVDMLRVLLEARCHAAGAAADGVTPLQLAIKHHASISPMAARLLMSARAGIDQVTFPPASVEWLRRAVYDNAELSNTLRHLVDEVSERPTVDVNVLEGEQVLGACFADLRNDIVAFYTDSVVGLFSVERRLVTLRQKLTQQRVQSVVRDMAVNPALGTIVVLVEVTTPGPSTKVQDLVIIWPTGQLQDEEPLKISVESKATRPSVGRPALVCSTSKGDVAVVGRLSSSQIICWHLSNASSQLISERELAEEGGLMAISSDGRWIALESLGGSAGHQVEIWMSTSYRQCEQLATVSNRRPTSLAIMQDADHASWPADGAGAEGRRVAWLALASEGAAPGPTCLIEVLAVHADGSTASAYNVVAESPCQLLSFVQASADVLLSGHADGVTALAHLPSGRLRVSHNDAPLRSASVSADQALMVACAAECFRVYRPAALASD